MAWASGVAVVGALVASQVGPRFTMPVPIDRRAWHIVSPGLDESIQDPALGRGVYIEDGALTLRQHAFHRAEVLSLKSSTPVARAEVDVLSGAVRMSFRSAAGASYATFGPKLVEHGTQTGQVYSRPPGQPWVVEVVDGDAVLMTAEGQVALGPAAEGSVEFTAVSEEVRLGSVEMLDEDGLPVLVEDYADSSFHPLQLLWGAVIGFALGVATRPRPLRGSGSARRLVGNALLVAPVAVFCAIPSAWWLYAVERMYLVRTPAWTLARLSLALSLLPALSVALLRTGVLVPAEREPFKRMSGRHLWLAVSASAALVAFVEGGMSPWMLAISVGGLGFLVMPLRIAREVEMEPTGALVVDLPAQLAVALGGWGPGLLVALGWRLLVLAASAGAGALRQAPRAVTDLLFVMLLLVPISLELTVRGTYLDRGWDMARLNGDLAPSLGWRNPDSFWTGQCVASQSKGEAEIKRVLWMGGSSTGGAYQFRNDPTAFFPAQSHQRLCDGTGISIRSENYGDGGRDSFTVSRSIAEVADRGQLDLIVVYGGVNDVLTKSGTKTRAQRETAQAERASAMSGLMGLGARSRVLTGLSLLVRPLHATDGPRVAEVPLADGAANFETIAGVAAEREAQVLLLTEVVRQEGATMLDPYSAMLAEVAERHSHVTFMDLGPLLRAQGVWKDQEMLVDQNHLSRVGSARVGAAIAPTVARLLGAPLEAGEVGIAPIGPNHISTVTRGEQ